MVEEDYYFEVGEEGQKGLDILDYLFNPTTQSFILTAGLKPGMRVLDIGCGLGEMTCWLARQVGRTGHVFAIDNNPNQIKATQKAADNAELKNISAICHSAYDLNTLDKGFDFVYCRFILHHLHKPTDVISSVYQVLNDKGIFVAEEGLVSQAFVYPFYPSWGDERWHNAPKDHDTEGKTRDGNFGMKLHSVMYNMGFKQLTAKLVQPVITSGDAKKNFIKSHYQAMDEGKKSFLQLGNSEADWQTKRDSISRLEKDDSALIGFYQSCQISGQK